MGVNMILVCGVHGAGKSYVAHRLGSLLNRNVFTASRLIYGSKEILASCEKRVDDIDRNQKILLNVLQNMNNDIVLDGHMCLLNDSSDIVEINMDYFKNMDLEAIYVVVNNIENIVTNLLKRDGVLSDKNMITEFQNREISYAQKVASTLNIKCHLLYKGRIIKSLKEMDMRSIILPIKPMYSDLILSYDKRYEYRKKLCVSNIKSIIIYSTSPISGLVGDVEVKNKIVMDKEQLWKMTSKLSGISKNYYDKYFAKTDIACAYELGKVTRYNKVIPLSEIGINYVPQGYVYYDFPIVTNI